MTVRIHPRQVALALVALLVAGSVLAPAGASSRDADRCPDLFYMDDVGLVCPLDNGLFEVYDRDGRSLGTTHGPDPVMDDDHVFVAAAARQPFCVPAGTDYSVVVIYARAYDDADNYGTSASLVRDLVTAANGELAQAAADTGDRADIRVQCDAGGTVIVHNEALPTPMASADYSTIISDLQNKGYNSGRMKYWVWYDDMAACLCAGTGQIYHDDRLILGNANNGNGVPMFAVTFGRDSVRTMLHELSHNMGAVQNSAPHSTGAGHCIDGRDTMCYNDGGPNGGSYSTSYCGTEIYDCGKDDYFHANPPSGSYLASYWNVGSKLNRFLEWGSPAMRTLTCDATVVINQPASCSYVADDDSSGVSYNLTWGDGASTRDPEGSGHVEPGVTRTASHAYANVGTFLVTVNATDNDAPPLTSAPLTFTLEVVPDEIPVVTQFDCPERAHQDVPASCSFTAVDDDAGIYYTIDWGDGATTRAPETGSVASGTTLHAEHAWTSTGNRTVTVTATDIEGAAHTSEPSTRVVEVYFDADAPQLTETSCPAEVVLGVAATCAILATDADSAGIYYTISWGDGATTRVPSSGYVAPGIRHSPSHTYAGGGDYTIKVTATDDAPTPHVSAPRVAHVQVIEDLAPPSIEIDDPDYGTVYFGCGSTTDVIVGVRPIFVSRGCIRATVTDAETEVASVQAWYGANLIGTRTAPPYAWEFSTGGRADGVYVTIIARDVVGNIASEAVRVDAY